MSAVGLIAAGALWWTLLEYLLHRFAFHKKGKFFGKRHLAHHADLVKKRLAIAPPQSAIGGAAMHAAVLFAVFRPSTAGLIFGGFLAGYLLYEWVHYSTHYRIPRTAVGRYLRAYHLAHHHKSPKARFGVTSPFWDFVFGTYQPVPRGRGSAQAAGG